ncbi:MAG: hypothetical protein QM811_19680 [Pirellulales bacterium]
MRLCGFNHKKISPLRFTSSRTNSASGIHRPPPRLFAELASIVDSGHPHDSFFKEARLLTTAEAVAAIRDALGRPIYDGYLLPILSLEQGEFPDVYGFDLGDPAPNASPSTPCIRS